MTHKEKIIATAYTGIMFVEGSELGEVYAYEEEKMGHGVIDIMHASKDFNIKVREAVKEDFFAMLKGEFKEPIDEDELDKLANKYYPDKYEMGEYDRIYHKIYRGHERDCFKVGYREAKKRSSNK